MKLIILIIIFLFFLAFSVFIYYKYLIRVKFFEDLLFICKYLKNSIAYNKNSLNVLLCEVFKNIRSMSKKILTNKKYAKYFLVSEDISLINSFFSDLGHGDVLYEINNLTYYDSLFADRLSFHKLNKSNGGVYSKLIVGLGLLIIILLI